MTTQFIDGDISKAQTIVHHVRRKANSIHGDSVGAHLLRDEFHRLADELEAATKLCNGSDAERSAYWREKLPRVIDLAVARLGELNGRKVNEVE